MFPVIIRTSLVPFACTSHNGVATLNADPSIICDTARPAFALMRQLGALSVSLYGVGLPLTFATVLFRHRVAITADQRLRMKGEGESSLTNPDIRVRRRYRKLYEDYKPQFMYWKLVLLARKLALASIGILLTRNPELQVSLL